MTQESTFWRRKTKPVSAETETVVVHRRAWISGMQQTVSMLLMFAFFFCTCTYTCDRNLKLGPHEVGCGR